MVGLGYVGLPLAVAFAEAGVPVLGLDAVQAKVDQVNAGESYIEDVSSERLAPLVADGRVRATTSWDALRAVDAVLICLPTPSPSTASRTCRRCSGRPRACRSACAPAI